MAVALLRGVYTPPQANPSGQTPLLHHTPSTPHSLWTDYGRLLKHHIPRYTVGEYMAMLAGFILQKRHSIIACL